MIGPALAAHGHLERSDGACFLNSNQRPGMTSCNSTQCVATDDSNRTFIAVAQTLPFHQASDYCRSHYSHLASIHSDAEMETVIRVCDSLPTAQQDERLRECFVGLIVTPDGASSWTDRSSVQWLADYNRTGSHTSGDEHNGFLAWVSVGLNYDSGWRFANAAEAVASIFVCVDEAQAAVSLSGNAFLLSLIHI